MKKNRFFWLRLFSTVVDIAVIYSLSILLQSLIRTITFIDFTSIFVVTLLAYYLLCYLVFDGQTLAKSLTQLKVAGKHNEALTYKAIVLREVVWKGLLGIAIPFYGIRTLFPMWSVLYTAIVLVLMLTASLLFLLLFRRTWWEGLSNTRTIKVPTRGIKRKRSLFAVAVLIASAVFIILYPFVVEQRNFRNSYQPPYPITKETTRYAQFVQQHAQSPEDYLFSLFRKYDVVVVSERLHPEYTQYELIFKIISDERFINEVGNLFTECGSVSFQDTLSSYLHTKYTSEDELNKRTAILQRNSNAIWPLWGNTNLFDLLKTVNKRNGALPDDRKVNWYFTDLAVDWRTMTHEKFIRGYTDPLRDSIMAAHIMEQYRKGIANHKRRKALVIMNTRHGYGLIDANTHNRFSSEYRGTTAVLMDHLPGKVANVMLNTPSLKYGLMLTPVQQGKWDAAFSQSGARAAGFDFANSPFGEDEFDAAFFRAPGVKYKDVFTGYVFYQPQEQHIQREGFPREFDNFEDTILRRAAYVSKDMVQSMIKIIRYHKQHLQQPTLTEPVKYALVYNLVNVAGVSLLLVVSLLTGVLLFLFVRSPVQTVEQEASVQRVPDRVDQGSSL